jgi:membrane protein implicated in regulation of membrane protease activity
MKSSTFNGLFCTASAFSLTTLAIAIGRGGLSEAFADPLNEAGCFVALLFFSALLLWRAYTFFTDRSSDDEGPLGI